MNVTQRKASTHAPSGGRRRTLARGDYTARPEQHQRDSVASDARALDVARARPIDRAAPPRPPASSRRHALARPQAGPVSTSSDRCAVRGSADLDGPRPLSGHDRSRFGRPEGADLLVQCQAGNGLARHNPASLVAIASTPSATLVTAICSPRCQGLLVRVMVIVPRHAARRAGCQEASMPVVVVTTRDRRA